MCSKRPKTRSPLKIAFKSPPRCGIRAIRINRLHPQKMWISAPKLWIKPSHCGEQARLFDFKKNQTPHIWGVWFFFPKYGVPIKSKKNFIPSSSTGVEKTIPQIQHQKNLTKPNIGDANTYPHHPHPLLIQLFKVYLYTSIPDSFIPNLLSFFHFPATLNLWFHHPITPAWKPGNLPAWWMLAWF